MDPSAVAVAASATKAFQDLWQIGGVVAVLLGILVVFVVAVSFVAVRIYYSLSKRLGQVEDSRVEIARGAIMSATEAMHHMAGKMDASLSLHRDTNAAIRSIPCNVTPTRPNKAIQFNQ